jgi:Nif-specific regulatory protein
VLLAAASAEAPHGQHLPVAQIREDKSTHSHCAQTLNDALLRHHGDQPQAAQSLGLTLRQFSYRLKKAGLR